MIDHHALYIKLKRKMIKSDIKKGDIVPSRKSRHFPKITDIDNFKELVNAIYIYRGSHSIRGALKLVLHLPFRAENVCKMKWEYINFEKEIDHIVILISKIFPEDHKNPDRL